MATPSFGQRCHGLVFCSVLSGSPGRSGLRVGVGGYSNGARPRIPPRARSPPQTVLVLFACGNRGSFFPGSALPSQQPARPPAAAPGLTPSPGPECIVFPQTAILTRRRKKKRRTRRFPLCLSGLSAAADPAGGLWDRRHHVHEAER